MSGEPFQAPWAPVTSTSWKGSKKSYRKIIKYIFVVLVKETNDAQGKLP